MTTASSGFVDYYKVLGFEGKKDFREGDLKSNFRKLALELHPDINKLPDAKVRMQDVNEAYKVLKDAKLRAEYDRIYDQRQTETGPEHRTTDETFREYRQEHGFDKWMEETDRSFQRFVARSEADFIRWVNSMDNRVIEPRLSVEDDYEQHRRAEAARVAGMNIRLPENDAYLIAAIARLETDKVSQKAVVRDEKGLIIWEVGMDDQGGLRIGRTLRDWAGPGTSPQLETSYGRKARADGVHNVTELDEYLLQDQGVHVPHGLASYVDNLRRLAETVTSPEGNYAYVEHIVMPAIGDYLRDNQFPGVRMRETSVGRIAEGLDTRRLTFSRETHEGKPPVV